MDALADRVRYLADNLSGTHREFAATVELEPTKLSKSMRGRRRFRTDELLRIAERMSVSTDWLLFGSGISPTPAAPHAGPAMARRTREARRRGEILDTTWHLLARHGYRVRLVDIAAACGTSVAALRHYFPSKQQLLQSALLRCAEQAFSRQQQELDLVSDAGAALRRLIDQLLPRPGQSQDEWLIWLHVSTESARRPELRAVHGDFHRRWLDLVAGVVDRGVAHGDFTTRDAHRFALEFMSLADGLAIRLLTGTPHHTVETMREVLLEHAQRSLHGDHPVAAPR